MNITEDGLKRALSNVIDPDFKKDLVTLGMVRDFDIDGRSVAFTLQLTTPACPLKEYLRNECLKHIHDAYGEDVEVDIDITADVTSGRNSDINVLPNVRNIICVASGKGGVGKSTVAVNLAYSLAADGARVGLIDADIHGPSIPTMLGVAGQRPGLREIKGKHYILPMDVNGVKVLSIGLLIDDRQAVVWRGPMVTSALKQFVSDVLWGNLDYLVVDMPPGTGDVHLTMIQTVQVTGAVIVTTPQEVAVADSRKALGMFRMPKIDVPILGVIENMSYFSPPGRPDEQYRIFGEGGGQALADQYEIPVLGELPIVEAVRLGGDNGVPAVLNENLTEVQDAWRSIGRVVAQQIAVSNAERRELEETEA